MSGGFQGIYLFDRNSHNFREDTVESRQVLSCRQDSKRVRRAVSRALPLHGLNAVHEGQAGVDVLRDIHQHLAEFNFIVAYQTMQNGFAFSDDQPKKVFYGQCQRHLAMGFELWQIDDVIVVFQVAGDFKMRNIFFRIERHGVR